MLSSPKAKITSSPAPAFCDTAPSFLELLISSTKDGNGADPFTFSRPGSGALTHDHVMQLATMASQFVDADGPVDEEETLIRYDTPFAPGDPKRSLRLRKKLGLAVEERQVDPNVRVILDSFIRPRRWRDAATGVLWEQHASPYVTSRTDTIETQQRLRQKLEQFKAKRTGTCPVRTVLVAECFLEVIRQVVAECWERGLLLLQVYTERVAAQAAHRELFESRVGHAFRLALKGEKDTAQVESDIQGLQKAIAALEEEERELRTKCDEFSAYAEEQLLIEEKQHNDAMTALRKEGMIKKNQLEQMMAVPTPQ